MALVAFVNSAHAFDINHKPTLSEFAQEDYECKVPYQEKYAWISVRPQDNSVVVAYGDNTPLTYNITNHSISIQEFRNKYGQHDAQWKLYSVRWGGNQVLVTDVRRPYLYSPAYYDCVIDYDRKLNDVPVQKQESVSPVQEKESATWGAMFKSQVERCWKKPYGGVETEGVEAGVDVRLNRDGTVDGTPTLEGTSTSPYARAYRESAVSAILKCQPYNLPIEYYKEWKYFTAVFSERKASTSPGADSDFPVQKQESGKSDKLTPDSVISHRSTPPQTGPGEGKPGEKLVCPKAADGSSNVCYWEALKGDKQPTVAPPAAPPPVTSQAELAAALSPRKTIATEALSGAPTEVLSGAPAPVSSVLMHPTAPAEDPATKAPNIPSAAPNATTQWVSQSEGAAFKARLARFWKEPGIPLTIIVRVRLNRDRRLAAPPEVVSTGTSPQYQAAAQSAVQALVRGQPYEMFSDETYDRWKYMDVVFDSKLVAAPPSTTSTPTTSTTTPPKIATRPGNYSCNEPPYMASNAEYKAIMLTIGSELPGMERIVQMTCVAKYEFYDHPQARQVFYNLKVTDEQINKHDISELVAAFVLRMKNMLDHKDPLDARFADADPLRKP
jgi:hypothetical protein